MASRNIDDLEPAVRDKARALAARCSASGLDLLIYCTRRSNEEQAQLYANGRDREKLDKRARELEHTWKRPDLAKLLRNVKPVPTARIVTNAGPGQSLHNYGLAFDAVPLRGGKPVWGNSAPADAKLWKEYGRLGQEAGLEWAGSWTTFREFPHMEDPVTEWQQLINAQLANPVIARPPAQPQGVPMNASVTGENAADAVHAEALARFNSGDPAARLEYSNTITRKHCPDLAARVREQFDEPFEQQHVCWELNTVQGPWAEHDSGGQFRWLPVRNADLDAVILGSDFLRMVYRHLVPA